MADEFTVTELAVWFTHTADLLGHYDAAPVLNQLRQTLAESVRHNFAGRHAPDGEEWHPLRVPDHSPLVRSGNLMLAAIESAYHSTTTEDTLSFDLSVLPDYWRFQQQGTRTIPPRPFLGFPDDFLDKAADALAEDVLRKMASQ